MKISNLQQKKIMAQLIAKPKLSFNQLWDKKEDSNKLAYHINKLEEAGLIVKEEGKYTLTKEGKSLSAFLDVDGETSLFPTIAYIAIIWNGNKLLCQERLKEPFRGYVSFISGTLKFGKGMLEHIKEDLKKQTGLSVNQLREKGFEEIITFENNIPLFHHHLFVFEGESTNDKLIQTSVKKTFG